MARRKEQFGCTSSYCRLQRLKLEVAQELGVTIPQDGYYGNYTSRETGSLGGYITKRLVQQAEQALSGSGRTL